MSLPYRYRLLIEVDIEGDGMLASGDGAKATADRLVELVKTDQRVLDAERWPKIEYAGQTPTPNVLGYLNNSAGAEAWRKGER